MSLRTTRGARLRRKFGRIVDGDGAPPGSALLSEGFMDVSVLVHRVARKIGKTYHQLVRITAVDDGPTGGGRGANRSKRNR